MFIESVMPSNHLIFRSPLLLLPSVFLNIRVFSNESAHHIMWPNFWSFSFSISPSNEHSRLISFTIDLFDFFAVQETFKSLLQHYSYSINSSALSLLYDPTLTSVHDYWKNHSFHSSLLLGWLESSFQFSIRCYGISQTNFLANPMN